MKETRFSERSKRWMPSNSLFWRKSVNSLALWINNKKHFWPTSFDYTIVCELPRTSLTRITIAVVFRPSAESIEKLLKYSERSRPMFRQLVTGPTVINNINSLFAYHPLQLSALVEAVWLNRNNAPTVVNPPETSSWFVPWPPEMTWPLLSTSFFPGY